MTNFRLIEKYNYVELSQAETSLLRDKVKANPGILADIQFFQEIEEEIFFDDYSSLDSQVNNYLYV